MPILRTSPAASLSRNAISHFPEHKRTILLRLSSGLTSPHIVAKQTTCNSLRARRREFFFSLLECEHLVDLIFTPEVAHIF